MGKQRIKTYSKRCPQKFVGNDSRLTTPEVDSMNEVTPLHVPQTPSYLQGLSPLTTSAKSSKNTTHSTSSLVTSNRKAAPSQGNSQLSQSHAVTTGARPLYTAPSQPNTAVTMSQFHENSLSGTMQQTSDTIQQTMSMELTCQSVNSSVAAGSVQHSSVGSNGPNNSSGSSECAISSHNTTASINSIVRANTHTNSSQNTVASVSSSHNTVASGNSSHNTAASECSYNNTVASEHISHNTVASGNSSHNTAASECSYNNTVASEHISHKTVASENSSHSTTALVNSSIDANTRASSFHNTTASNVSTRVSASTILMTNLSQQDAKQSCCTSSSDSHCSNAKQSCCTSSSDSHCSNGSNEISAYHSAEISNNSSTQTTLKEATYNSTLRNCTSSSYIGEQATGCETTNTGDLYTTTQEAFSQPFVGEASEDVHEDSEDTDEDSDSEEVLRTAHAVVEDFAGLDMGPALPCAPLRTPHSDIYDDGGGDWPSMCQQPREKTSKAQSRTSISSADMSLRAAAQAHRSHQTVREFVDLTSMDGETAQQQSLTVQHLSHSPVTTITVGGNTRIASNRGHASTSGSKTLSRSSKRSASPSSCSQHRSTSDLVLDASVPSAHNLHSLKSPQLNITLNHYDDIQLPALAVGQGQEVDSIRSSTPLFGVIPANVLRNWKFSPIQTTSHTLRDKAKKVKKACPGGTSTTGKRPSNVRHTTHTSRTLKSTVPVKQRRISMAALPKQRSPLLTASLSRAKLHERNQPQSAAKSSMRKNENITKPAGNLYSFCNYEDFCTGLETTSMSTEAEATSSRQVCSKIGRSRTDPPSRTPRRRQVQPCVLIDLYKHKPTVPESLLKRFRSGTRASSRRQFNAIGLNIDILCTL